LLNKLNKKTIIFLLLKKKKKKKKKMNENCIIENLLSSCNQLIDNLKDECLKLDQDLQEMGNNSNVHTNNNINDLVCSPYPTPFEAPMDIDENILNILSSYEIPDNDHFLKTVAFDNSTPNSNNVTEGTNIDSEIMNEEVLTMILEKMIENAPLGNVCNVIDFDYKNQNLLTMQENSVNKTLSDTLMKSFIEEIRNNNVSLLESTYSDNVEPKTSIRTILHNEMPS